MRKNAFFRQNFLFIIHWFLFLFWWTLIFIESSILSIKTYDDMQSNFQLRNKNNISIILMWLYKKNNRINNSSLIYNY